MQRREKVARNVRGSEAVVCNPEGREREREIKVDAEQRW